jgi:hypothetical protein
MSPPSVEGPRHRRACPGDDDQEGTALILRMAGASPLGAKLGERLFLLPLPACGERVGVRGPLHKGGLGRVKCLSTKAQTRGKAPSPGICAKSAQIPTSPRLRGEVRLPGCRLT